jgi:hypothetical protein
VNGASASACAASMSASDTFGRLAIFFALVAADSPARRPNTSRSDSELPPSRFDPCMPPATSPAAYRPGTVDSPVSGATSTPPIT